MDKREAAQREMFEKELTERKNSYRSILLGIRRTIDKLYEHEEYPDWDITTIYNLVGSIHMLGVVASQYMAVRRTQI